MRWPWISRKRHEAELRDAAELAERRERNLFVTVERMRRDETSVQQVCSVLLDLTDQLKAHGLPSLARIEADHGFSATIAERVRYSEEFLRSYARLPQGYERLCLFGVEIRAGSEPGSVVLVPGAKP